MNDTLSRAMQNTGFQAAERKAMKTAIEFFVVDEECSGRSALTPWERTRVDFLCRWLGHSLWRMHEVVTERGGWRYYVTICTRCGLSGHVQQDYFHGE